MTPVTRLAIPLVILASLLASDGNLHAQSPAERIEAIQREHADSLTALCRAFDEELLRATPPWSDSAFRWCLFGVPTDAERQRLSADAQQLSDLLTAMQPIIENRLRKADEDNDGDIDEAIQLSTVLMPLARARGLLLYGVAVDPVIGISDESRRAFTEAQRIAMQAESVSAWSDAERELIIAAASLRLGQDEPAIEAIRGVREAMREQPLLTEQIAGLAPTRAALETLLVAVARSPVEARTSMPEDEADLARLRLRLAAIAAQRASTADERSRLLNAETDRLANIALDLARDNSFDDLSWLEPIVRCQSLLKGANTEQLNQTAKAAQLIAEAVQAEDPRTIIKDPDLGPLTLLVLALELRGIDLDEAAAIWVDRLSELGLGFDRLASGTVLGESALERIGILLRVRMRLPLDLSDQSAIDRLGDLAEILVARPRGSRSNLDLLAVVSRADDVELARTLLDYAMRTGTADEDARLALGSSGLTLLDRLVRNHVKSFFDKPVISPEEEQQIIAILEQLADPLERAEGDAGLITTMRAAGLADPKANFVALRAVEPERETEWILEVLITRAALLAGQPLAEPVTDNTVFGAAIFVTRDLPDNLDIRGSVPDSERTLTEADSALAAGSVLSQRSGVYTRLAIRAFSTALRTNDPEMLRSLAAAAKDALARVEHSADRSWLSIIGAEAAMRMGDDQSAFGALRELVQRTPVEDRSTRAYWHASMRMLDILARQNDDGSRTPSIAREIRRLKLQPSWGAHEDICARIDAVAARLVGENGR